MIRTIKMLFVPIITIFFLTSSLAFAETVKIDCPAVVPNKAYERHEVIKTVNVLGVNYDWKLEGIFNDQSSKFDSSNPWKKFDASGLWAVTMSLACGTGNPQDGAGLLTIHGGGNSSCVYNGNKEKIRWCDVKDNHFECWTEPCGK